MWGELPKTVEVLDVDKREMIALEVFCGKAALTRALGKAGVKAQGIDFKFNKDKPVGSVIWIDLSLPRGQAEFKELCKAKDCRVVYAHFAPPCGTASRAREIRIKGAADPKPLRSNEHPDGVPGLAGENLKRVSGANELYSFTAKAIVFLHEQKIAWSVENPTNSLMWRTSFFCNLATLEAQGAFAHKEVVFHMCMHGGRRDKLSTFWYGQGLDLADMGVKCDGSHAHLPWGRTKEPGTHFATADERNYPDLLCRRIAKRVAKMVGADPPPKGGACLDKEHNHMQPRKGMNELVPEF